MKDARETRDGKRVELLRVAMASEDDTPAKLMSISPAVRAIAYVMAISTTDRVTAQ